ncbi:MAG: KH domain-containing protein [Thermomicrobiales bacterium]
MAVELVRRAQLHRVAARGREDSRHRAPRTPARGHLEGRDRAPGQHDTIVHTSKPGIVIGKQSANVDRMRKLLEGQPSPAARST